MSIKNEKTGKWSCIFCLEEFDRAIDADNHQKTHDFILLPITKSELSGLMQYLYQSFGDKENLLEESLLLRMRKLQRHRSNSYE